jgi:hypothetical protein
VTSFTLYIVEDLRSKLDLNYLFSLSAEKRWALEKEKVIFAGDLLVGASHICFQLDTVTDILLYFDIVQSYIFHRLILDIMQEITIFDQV